MSVTNGPFHQYSWNNGSTTCTTTVNSSDGYRVTVANSIGCQKTSAVVRVYKYANPPAPEIRTNPAPAIDLCPGTTVTITSGDAFKYLWSTGQTTKSITVNTAGSYSVTVYNSRGCSTISTAKPVSYLCKKSGNRNTSDIMATSARVTWNEEVAPRSIWFGNIELASPGTVNFRLEQT